jgi:NitT/TauT family transport system permease protein
MTALKPLRVSPLTRRESRIRVPRVVWQLLSVAAFLGLWQWYGAQPGTFAIPTVTETVVQLWKDIASGAIITPMLSTLVTMFTGLAVALVVGVVVGSAIGISAWVRDSIEPIVNALTAAPVAMLIPVIGIYIGLGFPGRVFLVFAWSVFVIIVNVATGVREVPASLLETSRSFGASSWTTYIKVVAPSAVPYIAVGFRLGLGRALRGAIAAELLLSVVDTGEFLRKSGALFNMPRLFGGIVFVTLVGLVLLWLAEIVENALVRRWNP